VNFMGTHIYIYIYELYIFIYETGAPRETASSGARWTIGLPDRGRRGSVLGWPGPDLCLFSRLSLYFSLALFSVAISGSSQSQFLVPKNFRVSIRVYLFFISVSCLRQLPCLCRWPGVCMRAGLVEWRLGGQGRAGPARVNTRCISQHLIEVTAVVQVEFVDQAFYIFRRQDSSLVTNVNVTCFEDDRGNEV
jgi:hypothetical protein